MRNVFIALTFLMSVPVYAIEISGGNISSIDISGTESVTFMMITDSHYSAREQSGYSATADDHIQAFVDAANAADDIDFIVNGGDWINNLLPVEGALADLATVEGIFNEFTGPKYQVLGNHDADENSALYITRAQYLAASTISDSFSYSFDVNGIHFVVIDSALGGFVTDGWTLPESVVDWLTADLAATDLPTVLFSHLRIDVTGEWNVAFLKNYSDIQDLLEADGDVFAVFQGHNHVNAYNEINGIKYITLINSIDGDNWATATVWKDGAVRWIGHGTATSRYP